MRHAYHLLIAACFLFPVGAQAEALPKYLTIDFVLSQVDDRHPAAGLGGTEQLVRRLRSCIEPERPLI